MNLRTVIVYPVPMETPEVWALFKPFVERFCRTYKEFPPGADHEIYVVVNGDGPAQELLALFEGMPVGKFIRYDGGGADIGSFQFFAKSAFPCFMVCCVTRVYFHKEGWLRKLVEARDLIGPGLFGTCASHEGGTFHLCCRCYAMDSDIFAGYPLEINSRDLGTFFEIGRGNINGGLADWFMNRLKLPVSIQFFNRGMPFVPNLFPLVESHPDLINGFRNGDQGNLLVWDKHSDAYHIASREGKEYLTDLMMGRIVPTEIV